MLRHNQSMGLFLDSFWRALAYCLMPRVMLMSLLPLALMVAMALGLGYFFWDAGVDWVRTTLETYAFLGQFTQWLQRLGMGNLVAVLAPLLLIFAVTPVTIVVSLLVVTLLMTPALVTLVAERRFSLLQRKQGGSLILSLAWSLGSILLALVALVVSIPLWFVPGLIVVLPPLIWGWLTYRVMTFDVLAQHASADERKDLLKKHRTGLLSVGIVSGFLGAVPSLLWLSVPMATGLFPILVPTTIWIYTLVFAFSALWFCHYALSALEAMRKLAPPPQNPFDTPPVAASVKPDSSVAAAATPLRFDMRDDLMGPAPTQPLQ